MNEQMVSYVGGPTSQNQVKRYWSHELWLKKWNNKALNTKHLIDIITLDLRQLMYIIKPHQIFYNNNKDNPKQSNIVRGKIH